MSESQREIPEVRATGMGHAGPGEGPDLSAYPLLVYSHRRGVHLEGSIVTVADIRASAWQDPRTLAVRFGTTVPHIEDARRYIADHPGG